MSDKGIMAIESRPDSADAQIKRLTEEIYRERVVEAREMPPEEKLLAGEELFEYACAITLAGIRNQFPGVSEEQCLRILEERLELRERMEKR
ncbi:MAG: hypothetical protein NT154_22090 [Verrucomicrobia bacterium]|nr:hypothetical protein [Verrucomicrobiota bacterium]